MFCLAVIYDFPPDRIDEALEHLTRLEAGSNLEPGCLMWKAHRVKDEPSRVFIYEQYVDEAAFGAHQASEHFQQHGMNGIRKFATNRIAAMGPPIER